VMGNKGPRVWFCITTVLHRNREVGDKVVLHDVTYSCIKRTPRTSCSLRAVTMHMYIWFFFVQLPPPYPSENWQASPPLVLKMLYNTPKTFRSYYVIYMIFMIYIYYIIYIHQDSKMNETLLYE
jgi:hypothetical protein